MTVQQGTSLKSYTSITRLSLRFAAVVQVAVTSCTLPCGNYRRTGNYSPSCTSLTLPTPSSFGSPTTIMSVSACRTVDNTQCVVILFWSLLACLRIQDLSALECGPNQYRVSGQCQNCTSCEVLGQLTLEKCSHYQDTACSACNMGVQYFDMQAGECKNCSICNETQREVEECTSGTDALCIERCQSYQTYKNGLCGFKCELCIFGCVTLGTPRCRCSPQECYSETDLLCRNNLCTDPTTRPTEVARTLRPQSNELPTWGIGLISIGVVVGIVAFSAGSMILSFCTKKATFSDENVEEGEAGDEKGEGDGSVAGSGSKHGHYVKYYTSAGFSSPLPPRSETHKQSPRVHRDSMNNASHSPQRLRGTPVLARPPPPRITSLRAENATPI